MEPISFPGASVPGNPNTFNPIYSKMKGLPTLIENGITITVWKPSLLERIKLLFLAKIEVSMLTTAAPGISLRVI